MTGVLHHVRNMPRKQFRRAQCGIYSVYPSLSLRDINTVIRWNPSGLAMPVDPLISHFNKEIVLVNMMKYLDNATLRCCSEFLCRLVFVSQNQFCWAGHVWAVRMSMGKLLQSVNWALPQLYNPRAWIESLKGLRIKEESEQKRSWSEGSLGSENSFGIPIESHGARWTCNSNGSWYVVRDRVFVCQRNILTAAHWARQRIIHKLLILHREWPVHHCGLPVCSLRVEETLWRCWSRWPTLSEGVLHTERCFMFWSNKEPGDTERPRAVQIWDIGAEQVSCIWSTCLLCDAYKNTCWCPKHRGRSQSCSGIAVPDNSDPRFNQCTWKHPNVVTAYLNIEDAYVPHFVSGDQEFWHISWKQKLFMRVAMLFKRGQGLKPCQITELLCGVGKRYVMTENGELYYFAFTQGKLKQARPGARKYDKSALLEGQNIVLKRISIGNGETFLGCSGLTDFDRAVLVCYNDYRNEIRLWLLSSKKRRLLQEPRIPAGRGSRRWKHTKRAWSYFSGLESLLLFMMATRGS
jgi:hypothetical protein